MDKKHLVIIETTPWDELLLASMEIAISRAHLGQAVEYFFLEDASTERRRIKSWIRRIGPLSRALMVRPERLLLEHMKSYVTRNDLPVAIHVVKRREWMRRAKRLPRSIFENIPGLTLGGLDAGKYILSSLITQTKDPYPSSKRHLGALQRSVQRFQSIAGFSHRMLTEMKPATVVVFNGRFLENGAIIEVCKKLEIPISFHEKGGRLGGRYFFEEFPIHDARNRGLAARRAWESMTTREREDASALAVEFLEKAPVEGGLGAYRAPKTQQIHIAPKANGRAKKVVFFTSTELEYVPDGVVSPRSGFSNQFDGIIALSRACRELGWDLTVRIHPNVSNTGGNERRRWDQKLSQAVVSGRVLGSRSGADSYQLIREADLVVVWHSTIALEAVFRGTPALCMAETVYSHAGADVIVASPEDDLVELLHQAVNHRPSADSALPFIHHFLTHGVAFKHLNPDLLSYRRLMNPLARFVWGLARRF